MYDDDPVNLTEVYHSPGAYQVENMNQLDYSPYLKDEHFAVAIKSGGPVGDHAILCLYKKYHKEVRTILSEMITLYPGSRSEPLDIVHDAFIIMLHKIQFESVRPGSLKSFWIGIARKIMQNQSKKNGRIILVEDASEIYGSTDVSPELILIASEGNEVLEEYFSRIGNRCKEILLLWTAQYTMNEIAVQLHLSGANMARKIKHSCFKKLKVLVLKGNQMTQ